jgi:hypothetical protein
MDTATLQRLLTDAANTIRSLHAEKEKLASALANYQRKELAEEIVDLMDARGMGNEEVPHKEKVAHVLSSGKDLTVTREALRMASTDMSFARVADEADLTHATASDKLKAFLLS